MDNKIIMAWHWCAMTNGAPVTRDGRRVIVGETVRHDGPLKLCSAGLHASVRITDALGYAPGLAVCRVRLGGDHIVGDDKIVASERTVLWWVDATRIVPDWARACARDVMHLWDPPKIVRDWLEASADNAASAASAACATWTDSAANVAWEVWAASAAWAARAVNAACTANADNAIWAARAASAAWAARAVNAACTANADNAVLRRYNQDLEQRVSTAAQDNGDYEQL